jgi:hypothetical protein
MTKKATLEAGGMTTKRVVVGITGASGAVYGLTALKALRAAGVETPYGQKIKSARKPGSYLLPV